jgi:DNA-binding FrmR family transcriptional regulator
MSHTEQSRTQILERMKRIRGQLNAAEKAVNAGDACSEVVHSLAAAKGALGSLIATIVEHHVREHIIDPDEQPASRRADATRELLDVVTKYLK